MLLKYFLASYRHESKSLNLWPRLMTTLTAQVDEKIAKQPKPIKDRPPQKRYNLHTPQGTKDYNAHEIICKNKLLEKITKIFAMHGAEPMDTPLIELKEFLTGTSEDATKLMFDIAGLNEEKEEKFSLRYDLTVPFARYLAMNQIKNMKRYQIGKVYRRDDPMVTKGRYREFVQCDFDIAGAHDLMVPDCECIRIVCEILNSLNIGDFRIKVNHRQLLNGILEICGVPENLCRTICFSIDRLDKKGWDGVREEMVKEKGISESVSDKIGEYAKLSGGSELLEKLLANEEILKSESAISGLNEMKLFLEYCDLYGVKDKIVFDLSLARGLDYYTGVIFEAVLLEKKIGKGLVDVGSVAGGGRYDNLVSKFNSKLSVPIVGLSIGIDRILAVLEPKLEENKEVRTTEVEVFVASAHNGLLKEKIKLVSELWDAGIKAEQLYRQNRKLLTQLQHCEENLIPWALIIGNSEIENDVVKIRNVVTREEVDVPRSKLIEELCTRLAR